MLRRLQRNESMISRRRHVIPAKAGIQEPNGWPPAFAGVTCLGAFYAAQHGILSEASKSEHAARNSWTGPTATRG